MTKIGPLAVITALLFASGANALSPTDGHIAGKSYINTYFQISYTWPTILKPMNLPSQAAADNGSKIYAFPLFSAREGDQPYGVVVTAEKLNVAAPHSTAVKNSVEFIDRIAHSLRAGPILSNINQSKKTNARGISFAELSYLQGGKPAFVMATQVGEYVIVFKCNAQSAAEIAQMENSVLALRMLK